MPTAIIQDIGEYLMMLKMRHPDLSSMAIIEKALMAYNHKGSYFKASDTAVRDALKFYYERLNK